MGVTGEDVDEIFQGVVVQFLHKNKIKSDIFNEKISFLTKMFSSFNLNSDLSYF